MKEFILRSEDHPRITGGTQTVYKFPNGYGASVITGNLFYTDEDHPYELAVVKFDGEVYKLDYSTPITNDVIGHLNEQGVHDTLVQIKALNKGE
jgi:hypothetical protein